MFASQGQAQAFLAMVYAGLAAGVAYDLLRLLRVLLKAGGIVTALLDLFFWVVAAGLVAAAAALAGVSGMRLYLFLGAASGALLWAAGLRRVMRGAGIWTAGLFAKRKHPPDAPDAGKQAGGGE